MVYFVFTQLLYAIFYVLYVFISIYSVALKSESVILARFMLVKMLCLVTYMDYSTELNTRFTVVGHMFSLSLQ